MRLSCRFVRFRLGRAARRGIVLGGASGGSLLFGLFDVLILGGQHLLAILARSVFVQQGFVERDERVAPREFAQVPARLLLQTCGQRWIREFRVGSRKYS